jgi:hypothetical protein
MTATAFVQWWIAVHLSGFALVAVGWRVLSRIRGGQTNKESDQWKSR